MRKIREALRLSASGLSCRKIGLSLGISHGSAGDYLRRAKGAGLSWPLSDDITDAGLEKLLFPGECVPGGSRPDPDWPHVERELRKRSVTLSLLWEEYRAEYAAGYSYSQFCERYNRWRSRLKPTLRQRHLAGEKMFVDYAGQTLPIIDQDTGEVHDAQIFVATLGASSYSFAEATWTQGLEDWLGSHERAFRFFQGVPEQVVPDNLKSAITKACFYEPRVNRSWSEMLSHNGTVALPARPGKPRDKAKVEVSVLLVERWILAKLRNRSFFSLAEANAAISGLLAQLNNKPSRHLGASRTELFEQLDRPALQPLPATPWVFARWKECRLGLDYHVEVERHYYSAPHNLIKRRLWVRYNTRTVEIFHRGERVAIHPRGSGNRKHTTIREHMPSSHRHYLDWTPQKLKREAEAVGPDTAILVEVILRDKPHPEQGFRSCLGILRLRREYGNKRLEAACARALVIGARSYGSVVSILKNNLDRRRVEPLDQTPTPDHGNIRGSSYYH